MEQEIYSDLHPNFVRDLQTKDLKKSININAIRNSIRNILQTRKMERRMMPEFGASLEQLLFEPIDEVTGKRIGSAMIEELRYWEPRINVTALNVISDPDFMRYDIILEYRIQSVNISHDVIEFTLQQ
jgi:uncharacterized protein